jgi:hypothetical protein
VASSEATTYDGVRQEFLSLYPNRIQGILRPPGCKKWTTVSKHLPIADETIIGAIAGEEKNFWGIRWAEQTRFAVFDIDPGSKYQTIEELQKLTKCLGDIGLKATTYQSSLRRGWHIYLFFDQWQNSSEVQAVLKAWLIANNYEIRNGTLEVSPDGRGFRLPLQQGFAWLDKFGNVLQRREDLATDTALRLFLDDLDQNSSDWTTSKSLIETQLNAKAYANELDNNAHRKAIDTEGFDELFNYRLLSEKYESGRQFWQTGLTAIGQRHDAILAVEHYLWHGDDEQDIPAMPGHANDHLRYELIRAWLEQKHNGFCNHIRRGNWRKVETQIKRAVAWRRPTATIAYEEYALTERAVERLIALYKATGRVWSTEDFRKGNEGRRKTAREKIKQAFELLVSQGRRVTLRQLMRLTGCCNKTISSHSDIWKISIPGVLSSVGGDLNSFLVLDLLRVPAPDGSSSDSFSEKILLAAFVFFQESLPDSQLSFLAHSADRLKSYMGSYRSTLSSDNRVSSMSDRGPPRCV